MGKLIESPIPTLMQGVSRQPDSVRLVGQVEAADNVLFSVETGGFTKRYGTQHIAALAGFTGSDAVGLHTIDRDVNEKYAVVFKKGVLKVFTLDGVQKTVTVPASAASYIDTTPDTLKLVTVADYTLLVNTTKTVAMSSAVGPTIPNIAVVHAYYSTFGIYTVTVNGVSASFTASTSSTTLDIAASIMEQLAAALTGPEWFITRSGSYVFIRNTTTPLVVATADPYGDKGLVTTNGVITDTKDLPARALDGTVVNVSSDGADFYMKFKELPAGSFHGSWQETVAPGAHVAFDPSTMPHALKRQADGTFILEPITWAERPAGDEKSVPNPDFVGRTIQDIVFHRNRFGLVADETCYFSQAGDYFNLWPDRSTEVLDSDPFGLTASTNRISLLKHAVPFRKAIFLTSDSTQFEISGDLLAPKKAAIDITTSYALDARCRPYAMGTSLYFASHSGDDAVLLEYDYDDNSVSNVATDVTKHVRGYLPSPILDLTGDAVNGIVIARPGSEPDALYTYTVFWNGDERAQSSWGRWVFPDAALKAVSFVNEHLYALVARGTTLCLERLSLSGQGYDDFDYAPRLDRQVRRYGSYNSLTNQTTWTLPYAADVVAVTSNAFPDAKRRGKTPAVTVSGQTVTARGDWAGHAVLFGIPYTASTTLSRQYLRDDKGRAVLNGRLQLRFLTLSYQDTGAFTVTVTPEFRETMAHTFGFTGRILGSDKNKIGVQSLSSGTFRVPIMSRGDTATITISNDTHLPHCITSAAWQGFFNEVTRQG